MVVPVIYITRGKVSLKIQREVCFIWLYVNLLVEAVCHCSHLVDKKWIPNFKRETDQSSATARFPPLHSCALLYGHVYNATLLNRLTVTWDPQGVFVSVGPSARLRICVIIHRDHRRHLTDKTEINCTARIPGASCGFKDASLQTPTMRFAS